MIASKSSVNGSPLTSRFRGTFRKGIHPREYKELAENAAVEVLPTPKAVRIPVVQHLGAPSVLSVKPRADVEIGDKIAEPKGFISASAHASVAGKVAREGVTTLPNGRHVVTIPIKAAKEQSLEGEALKEKLLGGDWSVNPEEHDPKAIYEAALDAGIVGLGGAAFPTHVKLMRDEKRPVRALLLNGCECEPFLTADFRLMIESPASIVAGALLAQRANGAEEVAICVEDNKPKAIEALQKAAEGTQVQVRVMKTKYPQGGEKQLIQAVTGLQVPAGGLPLDVGVVVLNVGTAASLARMVLREMPLTHRIVAVTGGGVASPKNVLCPIGVSLQEVVDYCGGLNDKAARVVAGGPMMGFAVGTLEAPVTKGTSGITVMTEEDIRRAAETACVRCGRCVEVCPMDLVPTKLALAARVGNTAVMDRYYINACMECGCCAYTCPASIPLVQLIRQGKVALRAAASKNK